MAGTADLVIVANRLPVDKSTSPTGEVEWRRSPGGLVSALEPVMRKYDGAWIGWPGVADDGEPLEPFVEDSLHLVPIALSAQEVEEFYEGFCNATLWPLHHDVVAPPEFHREWWDSYRAVNQRFAARAAEIAAPNATVWVHDYQLQLVPRLLRAMRPDVRIGFFLHIPFPPQELFNQLPWRRSLLEGLLGADLVGFQGVDAVNNFVRLVRSRVGLRTQRHVIHEADGRLVRAAAFPISIDVQHFEELARQDSVVKRAAEIRAALGDPERILLGIDRLDYTKGILPRLRAFSELVSEGHFVVGESIFMQVATPSRERVRQYQVMRDRIDQLVGRVNGDMGKIGQPVISYLHSSFPQHEMAALYRAADLMVVTPFRDGMNLVAKEYVACRVDDDGALVLSEFAGAASEFRQAWLVNPYDIDGIKTTLLEAAHADAKETSKRMRKLRRTLRANDVSRWADDFLHALQWARDD